VGIYERLGEAIETPQSNGGLHQEIDLGGHGKIRVFLDATEEIGELVSWGHRVAVASQQGEAVAHSCNVVFDTGIRTVRTA
jgi:hypothetical protein